MESRHCDAAISERILTVSREACDFSRQRKRWGRAPILHSDFVQVPSHRRASQSSEARTTNAVMMAAMSAHLMPKTMSQINRPLRVRRCDVSWGGEKGFMGGHGLVSKPCHVKVVMLEKRHRKDLPTAAFGFRLPELVKRSGRNQAPEKIATIFAVTKGFRLNLN